MKNLKNNITLLIIIFAIPLVGLLVGNMVSHSYEKKYEEEIIKIFKDRNNVDVSNNPQFLEKINLKNICQQKSQYPFLSDICNNYDEINNLSYVSGLTILFTLALFIFIFVLGKLARKKRNVLFYTFRPALFLLQISTSLLIVANSGITMFSIYFGESFYLGRVHIGLMITLGLATCIVVLKICIITLKPIKNIEIRVFGKILSKNNYQEIWNFVESIAKQLGTTIPDHIIAGMDPNFFVTETNVICLDGNIQGKCLFLSLPFCRIMTKEELTAIIGHEMAHFIGEDTKWSRKFYPIYRGAIETIITLHQHSNTNNGLIQLAFAPSVFFISTFINSFDKSVKEISRTREVNADKIGAQISSTKTMALALLKMHLYQHAWVFTQNEMKNFLAQGKQITNISTFFSTICSHLPDNLMKDEVIKSNTPHPTDSHPPLSIRLDSLGISTLESYLNELKLPTINQAIQLINDSEIIEKELSDLEHYALVKSGQVVLGNNENKQEQKNKTDIT